ncbi:MAG: hypothetical protein AMXMBFR64_61680 [Myxococcales bacterium]
MTSRRFLSLLAALALSAGCASGDSSTTADAGPSADVGSPDVSVEDAGPEDTGPPPKPAGFKATLTADIIDGNAPLAVTLSGTFEGIPAEEAELLWDFGNGSFSQKQDPGLFVYHTEGTYLVRFSVTWAGTPHTVSDQVVITVRGAADLRVTKPQVLSPTELPPGEILRIGYIASNDGGEILAPFDLVTVLSKDEKFDLDKDLVLETLRLDGMGRANSETGTLARLDVSLPLPADLKEGLYFLLVRIDAKDEVKEINELNNTALSTSFITVAKDAQERPDVAVTTLTYPAGPFAQGQYVNYSLTVQNFGTAPADSFKFRVFLSADTTLDDGDLQITDDGNSSIFSIAPGAKVVVQRGWQIPTSVGDGVYWLIAKADATEVVVESDESNNVLAGAAPFGVEHTEVTGFDLDILAASVTPHATYWNGSVKVDLEVANAGNAPSEAWTVAIYASKSVALNPNYATLISKVPLVKQQIIPAGGSVTISEVVKLPGTIGLGTYYIGAIVDPDNALDELDEGNNWAVIPDPVELFDKASADIAVSGVAASPLVVTAGEHLKVSYLLGNTGSTGSGAMTNLVVLSKDPVITLADVKAKKDVAIAAIPIANVDPGDAVEQNDKVVVPLALDHTVSTWWLGVVADANNDVSIDPNKQNNVGIFTQPLTVLGPQGGCFEDALEPNDNASQAKPLGPGLHGPLGSCGNEDWFAVTVAKGHSLFVTVDAEEPLWIDPRPWELGVTLHDLSGKTIDESVAKGVHDEVRAYVVPEDTTLRVRVRAATFGNEAHYTIGVKVVPPVKGIDLVADDVVALPELLYPGGALDVAWRIVNLGDEASGPFTVHAVLVPTVGTPVGDGVLLGSVPVANVGAATSMDGGMQVLLPSVTAGAWHVLVVADAESDVKEVDETNNAAPSGAITVDAKLSCASDAFEPNDAPGIAATLAAKSDFLSGLTVCPKLDDWYAVDLPKGKAFGITVKYAFEAAKGELGVEVSDPTGAVILQQLAGKGTAAVLLPYVFNPGVYKIRVFNVAANGSPYTYSMGVSFGSPSSGDICKPDVFEPNGAPGAAAPVGCGLHELTLCKTDKDWLAVPVKAEDEITVTLDHPKGELEALLYTDPAGKAVATVSGNGAMKYTPTVNGALSLLVRPKAKDGNVTVYGYTLFVDGIDGTDLRVGALAAFPDQLVQGEDTVVEMRLENQCKTAAQTLDWSLYVSTDDQWDPFDLEVLAGSEGGLAGKHAVDLVEKASVPAGTPPGTAWLIAVADPNDAVAESIESNNSRSLPVQVLAVCVEDPLEPNATPAQAPKIQANQPYPGLALCPGDLDWYKVDLVAGKVVTVAIQFQDAAGDLDLRLYGPFDQTKPVASSNNPGQDGETIKYLVKSTGTHWIRVNGFNGASNVYSLKVTAP